MKTKTKPKKKENKKIFVTTGNTENNNELYNQNLTFLIYMTKLCTAFLHHNNI